MGVIHHPTNFRELHYMKHTACMQSVQNEGQLLPNTDPDFAVVAWEDAVKSLVYIPVVGWTLGNGRPLPIPAFQPTGEYLLIHRREYSWAVRQDGIVVAASTAEDLLVPPEYRNADE